MVHLSGTIARIFSRIMESDTSVPSKLTLLTMLSNLSEYSVIVSHTFIFCNSNSLIKVSTCMPLILLSSIHFLEKIPKIAFVVLSDITLVKMVVETTTNRHALAFDFLFFLPF